MIVILKIFKKVVMFRIGDKVIIKYRPPLYMKGYIDYVLPVGVIVYDFGNGVYRVGLNTGDEYVFDKDQLELNHLYQDFFGSPFCKSVSRKAA